MAMRLPSFRPVRITFARQRAAIESLLSSSAERITLPSFGTASASMPFSKAMASRLFIYSICAVPMLVMIAQSGLANAASGAISPGWFMPISQTAALSFELAARMERGTPIWLFRLPWVLTTLNLLLSTAAANSLVLVLPLLPVMPRTLRSSFARHAAARLVRAVRLFSARRTGTDPVSFCASSGESRSTAAAPFSIACEAKMLPSKFSPRSPM